MGNGGLAPHILNQGTGLRATINYTVRYAVTIGGYHTWSDTISCPCWEPNHNPRCPASCDTVLLILFLGEIKKKIAIKIGVARSTKKKPINFKSVGNPELSAICLLHVSALLVHHKELKIYKEKSNCWKFLGNGPTVPKHVANR